MKIETPADMSKFAKGLAASFLKDAASHKAIATEHTALSKSEKELGTLAKSKADSMDDANEMKAFLLKQAEAYTASSTNHEKLAKAAETLATDLEAQATEITKTDAAPAPAAAAPAGAAPADGPQLDGIAKMLDETTASLVKKALEALNTDPEIQKTIQAAVLSQVNSALSGKLVPDGVKTIIGSVPTRVARAGQEELVNKADVPAEFQGLVEVEV